jgi:asparagine synthase (glutamine-hydrolysing)
MCGIAGIMSLTGRPVDLGEVRSMCGAMKHRGPDDQGFHVGEDIGLGMRRLSIIDLATGQQPVRNEDGSVLAVCNGEIYNFKELRDELVRRGHRFRSGSDSETIVHLYEDHGARCVERMRGMFAFALWDARRRMLLLARDRLGIKPLYYASVGGRLIFASELKAVLQLPEVERRLNWSAVDHLFTSLSTPSGDSIVAGVRKLEPGRLLIATAGRGSRIEPYWDLRFVPDGRATEEDCVQRLRELLEESVRLHLVSDVPLGAFLSGGIDSSAVVATMARLGTGPVKTFSIGFAEEDYDELAYARRVAKAFATEHHELILSPDVVEIVDDLAWYLDEPFGDSSAIPTYMVSRLAAGHVTVALSGDGGDELFAGYDKYRVEARERRLESLLGPVRAVLGAARAMPDGMRGRNFLRHFSLAGVERYLDAQTLFRWEDKRRLFRPEAFEQLTRDDPRRSEGTCLEGMEGDWLSALQAFDFKTYLPLDILTKVDRMSMAHGLEARVPLLDHRLVEFAATIPAAFKLRDGTTKHIFKRAMRGLLPDAIIDRRKRGFAVPLGRWFRGRLGGFVRDLLLSERSRRRGIFNEDYIERLLKRHERGRALDLHLWTLISFELWCRTFLDTCAPRRVEAVVTPVGSQVAPAAVP